MPTVDEAITDAAKRIRGSQEVDLWRQADARVNAEEMMSKVLGREVSSADLARPLSTAQAARFWTMVDRRCAGEPVALIVGETEFRGLRIPVKRGVFIPRSSSEFLAGEAIRRLRARPAPVAVDVATGCGPVALSVAREVKKARVYGVDISAEAVAAGRAAARRLGITGVRFLQSDMLASLPRGLRGGIDVFTLHPPYVARSLVRTLPREIRDFEPFQSLTDRSSDGLGLARRLAEESREWLRRGGWTLIEVSPDLSRGVAQILRSAGFTDVRSRRDSLGATRVIGGRWRGRP